MAGKLDRSLTVLAPKASFASVHAAACGEEQVDWTAAASAQQEACTLCFAAVDAAELLSRIPGIDAQAVAFDGDVPAGSFVLVLSALSFAQHQTKLQSLFGDVACPSGEQSFVIRSGGDGYLVLGADRAGAM